MINVLATISIFPVLFIVVIIICFIGEYVFIYKRDGKLPKKLTKEEKEIRHKQNSEKLERLIQKSYELKTIPELIYHIEATLDACSFFKNYDQQLKDKRNDLSFEISLCFLESEKLTKKRIKDLFDYGIATSTGIKLSDEELNALTDYYWDNYYDDNKQKEYFRIIQERLKNAP